MSMSSGTICWEEGNDVGGRGVFLRHGCLRRWSISVSVVIWNNLSASLILWPKRSSFTQSHTHREPGGQWFTSIWLTQARNTPPLTHTKTHVCLVAQLCPTFCDPRIVAQKAPLSMGILQARILEWIVIPPPADLPYPGIEPRSPILQAISLPSEPSGNC